MIAKVFKELGWVEELGSGRKNIMKYAPYYYQDYRIEIENNEKFVFSLTYRDEDERVNEKIKISEDFEIQPETIYALINEKIKDRNDKINDGKEKIKDKINERLFTIIKYLYLNPHQNRKNLINLTRKEQATTDRYIKILKDVHIIEYKGSKKTGGYYLTREAIDRIEKRSRKNE